MLQTAFAAGAKSEHARVVRKIMTQQKFFARPASEGLLVRQNNLEILLAAHNDSLLQKFKEA
jgi:hypothetical protein